MSSARADQLRRFQGAKLLTASGTTGWLDWIHGELWLFPSGLLRIRLGWWKTTLHGIGFPTNPSRMKARQFDSSKFASMVANSKNLWIPREQIRQAYLHHGILTDRLRLVLADGRSVKFLWLVGDGAFQPLQAILQQWIGDNLFID